MAQNTDELDEEQKQRLAAPIGKPIVPQAPSVSSTDILPGVSTKGLPPDMPPPEMPSSPPPSMAPSGTISGIGSISKPSAPMTPRPEYHGLNRVLDTIAGATNIGSSIEAAGGLGTEGWRQKNADEERQIEETEKQKQAEATTGKTGAEAGEAKARGDLAESQSGQVVITDPITKHTITTNAKDAAGIWRQIIGQTGAGQRTADTNQTRQDVADTNQTGATDRNADTNATRERIAKERPGPRTPEAEQAIGDYLKGQGLPDTPPNRDKARVDIAARKPNMAVQAASKSAQDSMTYAQDYLSSGTFTGPGDEALMEQFFNIAKPSTGFRMSQPQINMLMTSRSWMDSAEGVAYHAKTGQWFPPDQRKQIVDTMVALAKSKGVGESNTSKGESNKPSATGGAGAGAQSPASNFAEFAKRRGGH